MSTVLAPQQPDLRAFIVYDAAPRGWIAHLVTDDATAPILRPGDVALIDPAQRDPIQNELFLIVYGRGQPGERRAIVEMDCRSHFSGTHHFGGWWSHPYNRPRSFEESRRWIEERRRIRFSDGPIDAASPSGMAYLRNMLVGRVVGLLAPSFAEPMRQIGQAS